MRTLRLAALLLVATLSLGQSGFPGRDPIVNPGVEIEDQLDVFRLDNRIIAVDARNQRQREVQLEVGERIIALESRGLVAVAVTTARLLGVSTQVSQWQELRYRVEDRARLPERVFVGDRVALVPLQQHLVAMSTTSKSWSELQLGPREPVGPVYVGNNIAVAVTPRRAIAFAPKLSDFVEIGLTPQEQVESASTNDSSVSLTTSRRLLTFRVGSGRWTEIIRKNRVR